MTARIVGRLLGILLSLNIFTQSSEIYAASDIPPSTTDSATEYTEHECHIHPFVVITPPKCGTHLIGTALGLMLDRECYSIGHLSHSDEDAFQIIESATQNEKIVLTHQITPLLLDILVSKGYKVISIIRDPRDQLISLLDFIDEGSWAVPDHYQLDSADEYLDELITGEKFGWRSYFLIKDLLEALEPLVQKNCCYFTRFESLIGSQGGGSDILQLSELSNLAIFLNFRLTENKAKNVREKLYGNSWTFRHGVIQRWKNYFTPYRKELYKSIYGEELIRLGYEKDLNW